MKLTIDGVEHELSYTWGDFAEAERRLKRDIIVKLDDMYGTEKTEVLAFVGLCRAIPDLTIEKIRDNMTFAKSRVIGLAFTDAIQRQMGDSEEGGEPAAPFVVPETSGITNSPTPESA